MAAFLDMLAYSEGTSTMTGSDDGYNVNVGGSTFASYAEHPRRAVLTRWGWSDAAGRYQIMAAIPGRIRTDTWDWASRACGVHDFSPMSQDKVAAYLVTRRGALPELMQGRFEKAVRKCRLEWASLPGAGYGQREHGLDVLRQRYVAFGGIDIGS
jgi:muramidase (phage lysozyme)